MFWNLFIVTFLTFVTVHTSSKECPYTLWEWLIIIRCESLKVCSWAKPCDKIQRCHENPDGRCYNVTNEVRHQFNDYEDKSSTCVLPPYPQHGSYVMITPGSRDTINTVPGDSYETVFLRITCEPGYIVENERESLYCHYGNWSDVMPKCMRICRLNKHPSVKYQCREAGSRSFSKECGDTVTTGAVVQPTCNIFYDSPGFLIQIPMFCKNDGTWTYIAVCQPECGTILTQSLEGTRTMWDQNLKSEKKIIPWRAGVYVTRNMLEIIVLYQICGGSLISTTTIISAASCFWNEETKQQSVKKYKVAIGKLKDGQKSDIANVVMPSDYNGNANRHHGNIAIVNVVTPFTYQMNVRPVCIDFDRAFENRQLEGNNLGTIAVREPILPNGSSQIVIRPLELPYLSPADCLAELPLETRDYMTHDKFCAGFYSNGTRNCTGFPGEGITFPVEDRGKTRYYLRGVASTALSTESPCFNEKLALFTQLSKYENLIKNYL